METTNIPAYVTLVKKGETDYGRIAIRLTPNAKLEKLGGLYLDGDNKTWLRASVRAVPEKGKANIALIKLLAKALEIPKSSIQLVKGDIARMKIVELPVTKHVIKRLKLLGS